MQVVVAGKGPAWERISSWNFRLAAEPVPVPAGAPLVPGDVLVSVQYDRRVTADELAQYRQAVNIHFGPLPELRGCFPTKWAIINGEPAGVTLHHMTSRLDDGPVISVCRFDTAGMSDADVYARCNVKAVKLWSGWWMAAVTGFPPGEPQDEARARYYPRRLPFDGRLPANAGPVMTDRLRRAFDHPPYPGLVE